MFMRRVAAIGNVIISYMIPVLMLGTLGIVTKKPDFWYNFWLNFIKPNGLFVLLGIVLIFLVTILSSNYVKVKSKKGKYFSGTLSKSFKTVKNAQVFPTILTFISCLVCFLPTLLDMFKGNSFKFNISLLIPVGGIILLIISLRITGILGSALFYNMFMQGLINSDDQKELTSFSRGLFKSLYAAKVGYQTSNGLN